MTARILDGKAAAAALRAQIASEVSILRAEEGVIPGLAVIIVGDSAASQIYVSNKIKACTAAGMVSRHIELLADISLSALIGEIERLNKDPAIHGILVQLPLPPGLDQGAVISAINPAKDVDGFHPSNVGGLWSGKPALVPCTPSGCMRLITQVRGEDLSGLTAVIVGRSNIVGKPMAALMLAHNATVTLAHSRTKDLKNLCATADILVAAVGRPRMIGRDWVKPGATVIDVGINRIDAGEGRTRLVGDVDFEEVLPKAGAITPVPGGVGPMTIAELLEATLVACKRSHGLI